MCFQQTPKMFECLRHGLLEAVGKLFERYMISFVFVLWSTESGAKFVLVSMQCYRVRLCERRSTWSLGSQSKHVSQCSSVKFSLINYLSSLCRRRRSCPRLLYPYLSVFRIQLFSFCRLWNISITDLLLGQYFFKPSFFLQKLQNILGKQIAICFLISLFFE